MSLKDKILEDVKTAMKSRDSDTVSTLRFVVSALKNKEIEVRPNTLTDQDAMGVLKKLCKQRQDSIEQFTAAGRDDLVLKEKTELAVIETYLPAQLSEDDLKKMIQAAITEVGASSPKDMGKVMQAVTVKTQGNADNKLVSQIVKSLLQ